MTDTGEGGIRGRRREWMRAQILAAAWELVRAEGFSALSLRELAGRVGMRAPSLYTYFGSKDELLDAMYAQGMQQFAEQLGRARLGRTPRASLRNRARVFTSAAVEDPVRYQLLFQRPIPGFVPSVESLAIALAGLAETRAVAEAAGLADQRAFDLFMATTRGLVEMQLANEPDGDRWVRLVDEAVNLLTAHYAPAPRTGTRTPRPARRSAGDSKKKVESDEHTNPSHT
jgi:AcrR family transcriptional regulator